MRINKIILSILAVWLLIFSNQVHGQWMWSGINKSSNSVVGENVLDIVVCNGKIFTCILLPYRTKNQDLSLFSLSNNESSWEGDSASALITPPDEYGTTYVCALAVCAKNIIAGTYINYPGIHGGTSREAFYLSADNGSSWTPIITKFSSDYFPAELPVLATSGNNVFAAGNYSNSNSYGDSCAIYLSTNSGKNWTEVSCVKNQIISLIIHNKNVFAGTRYREGILISKDDGISWTPANSGLPNDFNKPEILSFTEIGNDLFAGTNKGIYLSQNDGTSWSSISSGLPDSIRCSSFAVSDSIIFTGTSHGVFYSIDHGKIWTAFSTGLADTNITSLVVWGGDIYAGTKNCGIWHRPFSEILSAHPQTDYHSPLQTSPYVSAFGSLHSGVRLNYRIATRCIVRLDIYSISGTKIVSSEQGIQSSGEYSVTLGKGVIQAGMYVYRFQAGSYRESNLVRIVK